MVNCNWTSEEDFEEMVDTVLLAALSGDLAVDNNVFDPEDIAAVASLGLITTRVSRDVFCGEWQLTPKGREWLQEIGINTEEDDVVEIEE